jgi:DNA polymerase alpha subunit B
MSHLQTEVKDRIIEEEANLHVYSSNDVDMLVPSQIQLCAFLSTKHLAFLISFSRKIIMQK